MPTTVACPEGMTEETVRVVQPRDQLGCLQVTPIECTDQCTEVSVSCLRETADPRFSSEDD